MGRRPVHELHRVALRALADAGLGQLVVRGPSLAATLLGNSVLVRHLSTPPRRHTILTVRKRIRLVYGRLAAACAFI